LLTQLFEEQANMQRASASLRAAGILAAAVLLGANMAAAQEQTAKKAGNAVTDSWITMKVHSQFIPEDVLEGSDIDVDTNAGVVTLKGTVLTEAARTRAVAIAKATDGVKSVKDSLRIGPADADAREAGAKAGAAAREATGTAGRAVTDGWIKSKIYSQYLTEDALDDSDIDLDVTRGAVVLNGTVKSDAGKTRAEAIAKATDGVKSVKNNLKVNPSVK
jgi:hyperosmotically inducible protein